MYDGIKQAISPSRGKITPLNLATDSAGAADIGYMRRMYDGIKQAISPSRGKITPLNLATVDIWACLGTLAKHYKLDFCLQASSGIWGYMYRLVTYCVYHKNASSLLISIVLLLLMGRWLERRLGTFPFLLLSVVCAVGTALLYILFTKLLGLTSYTVCGYSAVNSALLTVMCYKSRGKRLPVVGRVPMVTVPFLLLVLAYHFIPGSELLAHISGVPVGLAYSAGFFHCLELSEQQLDKLENLSFCRLTSQNSFISFIRSPKRGCLPVTNSIDSTECSFNN
ncbi:rhomboid domain-containing protein 3-like [Protopterus annectens]|uniref:rhomboid domain-containing protein 3-like n=1 Tax=Protopterus annectens TaxID=7888 RepID=UPI001CFBE475|nr:rhomboid domain-containing protein 3-like [Protopterus annectens]